MMNMTAKGRTDRAARIVKASPQTIYRALVDPDALVSWLPPKGMKGEVHAFEPRAGGAYHMTLFYESEAHSVPGKTSAHADVIRGQFLELSQNERIVQRFEFASDDPAFAGPMTMTWRLSPVPEGTEVTIICENVPEGIRKEDHDIGMRSTLENLAAFTEQREAGSPP
ncbi:SRPBCC family protein [Hyphomicrobium sp. CS1BSMeth3]|uniref:SRPBCC family protein n=1 Tax=Hyphomicrobium sp. CS1BSMeth3 TaxID=1892844 RepID=UPI000930B7E0|nr:SRPBCC family protein [Hyphomicrobium sp. CS1BSMeth3]